jgi:hypothetical protein
MYFPSEILVQFPVTVGVRPPAGLNCHRMNVGMFCWLDNTSNRLMRGTAIDLRQLLAPVHVLLQCSFERAEPISVSLGSVAATHSGSVNDACSS